MTATSLQTITIGDADGRSWIERPRLIDRLREIRAPIVALVAPAGYGKTTLLRQWACTDGRPVAWIDLTSGAGAPAALMTSVAAQLAMVEGAEATSGPLIMVLDDAHLLDCAGADRVLALIAEHLPEGSVLALASRAPLNLRAGRLRLEGVLVELGAMDLAMTRDEATCLLTAHGFAPDGDDLSSLMDRTEGWPAALALAARASNAEPLTAAHVDRAVAAYVREEVVERLSSEAAGLLLRTSVLEEVTGECADALGEADASGELLRELSRVGGLVTAMDAHDEVFRVHPLLRDLLAADLARSEPLRRAALHLDASRWFEAQGSIEAAITHAIEAGDSARAGRLLWDIAPGLVGRGRPDQLQAPLGRLHEAQLVAEPTLALSAALALAGSGQRDLVEQWLDVAEAAMVAWPAQSTDLACGLSVLRACVARDGLADMRAHAAAAAIEGGPQSLWAPMASLLQGVAHQLSGDPSEAVRHLTEGGRRATRGAPLFHVLCTAQHALLDLAEERWDDALERAGRARTVVDAEQLGHLPIVALVYSVSAYALAHGDDLAAARADRTEAEQLLAQLDGIAPWYEGEVRVALAFACLRLSDAPAAREHLTAAGRALRHCSDAPVLRGWIDDAWERSDTFAAGAVAGVATLTTAELRVLRMLPSHLTLREIGARLHVSANTVKTQAHAVYRKLDASSRSQAVARAREVGLVDR